MSVGRPTCLGAHTVAWTSFSRARRGWGSLVCRVCGEVVVSNSFRAREDQDDYAVVVPRQRLDAYEDWTPEGGERASQQVALDVKHRLTLLARLER